MIKIYKFGGTAAKDADDIKKLAGLLLTHEPGNILVVVSAMGQTTHYLEKLTEAYVGEQAHAHLIFGEIKQYHTNILNELFEDPGHPVFDDIANAFIEIDWILEDAPHPVYNFNYDQIVSVGELVSSRIVAAYLNFTGIKAKWLDARGLILTDNNYREARVDHEKSCAAIQGIRKALDEQFIITQGCIGGTSENFTTTLGPAGSDHSAAIFASCLGAEVDINQSIE